MKDSNMETQKTTSRTSLLNLMLLKAWRERWTDCQWGINIKTVLPRGVSGDVYNLADCILQQAVVGSNHNQLILSYLRHSLCSHLISYAAVIKRISKYDNFDKVFCITALLDFLDSIVDGITCRGKTEESVLTNALVSLVYWLMKIYSVGLEVYEANTQLTPEQKNMLHKTTELIEKITKNKFLLGVLYIGKHEDVEFYTKITEKYSEIKNLFISTGYVPKSNTIEDHLRQLAYIDVNQLDATISEQEHVELITYCVQPLLAVEVLLNPSSDTQVYVSELLMIQRLKNYSTPRLYCEIIRAGLMSLSSVSETTHDTIWCAFTFIKVPHILKQLNSLSQTYSENVDHLPDVVAAFEILLEDTSILDFMDTKCACNTIEYLLNDWAKQHLVNEKHITHFSSKRESVSTLLQKREVNNQAPSIINFVIRTEVPLSGLLKTLSTDYNKVQEALLGMLCQVLVGNSFELILAVATVEGRLRTFVSRLIKCNENSKQKPGEVGKPALVRSSLFDVSFLILTFIVQTYGSDVVLAENGDSFFEKWVRECMVEKNKAKSPRNMAQLSEENIVDELLLCFRKQDGQIKNCNVTWQDICMNIPGVLYQVLIAWENESLSSADVKGILDSIKSRLFCFSVCAASFLCAYMQTVQQNELLKPVNMLQQFLNNLSPDEMPSQENIKEKLGLSFQIIKKMQQDFHPTGAAKIRISVPAEQFNEVWRSITDRGWLRIKAAQMLDNLLQACGPVWLVNKLVEEILKCIYTRDMMRTMDIVFAVMHLDIERNTVALLDTLLPIILLNKQTQQLTEPQSSILARLCVYCIISNLEAPNMTSKKRSRNMECDDMDNVCNVPKIRKLNPENSGDSCSSDFIAENIINKEPPLNIKEPLQSSLQNLFKTFSYFAATDELSPKVYFIYHFISILVECGKDRIKPILKLIPTSLPQNLLKVMPSNNITAGLICRLYDLRSTAGRQSAMSDLCLLRNMDLRKKSVKI